MTPQNPETGTVASNGATEANAWPLFYREPRVLSSVEHAQWRVRPTGVGFAAASNSVPVVVGEFAAAARSYPLVFAGPDNTPLAVLGVEAGRNRFVNGDAWTDGAYVPAYVRRYPFVFVQTRDPEGYVLAIDAGSDAVIPSGEEGSPLFENGEPSELTRQALQFCDTFTREDQATRTFAAALAEQGLLIERSANIAFADGRRTSVDGFQVVDGEKFAALPDAVVVDWHRKGWLALVHFHLASLGRFNDLLTP
ncbi:SapC family protein [Pseudoxanthomonas sp. z9]|uniref:SapC family protein n=1 Tax=Pseudoxanthomonas sp. z9 TaxID=2584942 RepID=UPI001144396D|nr:SapC family protein [Pseudoxanthomonas sp. z9]